MRKYPKQAKRAAGGRKRDKEAEAGRPAEGLRAAGGQNTQKRRAGAFFAYPKGSEAAKAAQVRKQYKADAGRSLRAAEAAKGP